MTKSVALPKLDLWGGIECTVNRVGEHFYSQLDGKPYADSTDDLDRFAALGITALRFPVLWERSVAKVGDKPDWSWSDNRLEHLRTLDVMPIVGLVHHGSGPVGTGLDDPLFGEKLAGYASQVARRYPWIEHYTPVNEPLTTSRFSGLYGLWHPHGRDVRTFKDALFNQCRGIVLAMRAIERINPKARLVQTDDLGTTSSTPLLAYQANFNNHLRWLAWDLVSGRVNTRHALWRWLRDQCMASIDELLWFQQNARTPDLIGINHYVTSDRFLDERIASYPTSCAGGNGQHRYADVETARASRMPITGVQPLIECAWSRYAVPVAVTEVHIDATREDQMRWLAHAWAAAEAARANGADVRAVTVWSLLGSYDWNSLLTKRSGYYESGAYDVRNGRARPTAVAKLMPQLARTGLGSHPVLTGLGWWQRPERLSFVRNETVAHARAMNTNQPAILIAGAKGTLANAFARICTERDLEYRLLDRTELDIADIGSVNRAFERYRPWAIVNAAGFVHVEEAESDAKRCFRENALGPTVLASLCARDHVALLTFSTDLVFDGRRQTPYLESDDIFPLSVYGRSKARAEAAVRERHPDALIVRTSAFFGPWDTSNFISDVLNALMANKPFLASNDVTTSPTYVPDLVNACLNLLIDGEAGLWHLTNGEAITWMEFALKIAHRTGCEPSLIQGCKHARLGLPAPRPSYSALGSEREFMMPTLDDAMRRFSEHLAINSGCP